MSSPQAIRDNHEVPLDTSGCRPSSRTCELAELGRLSSGKNRGGQGMLARPAALKAADG